MSLQPKHFENLKIQFDVLAHPIARGPQLILLNNNIFSLTNQATFFISKTIDVWPNNCLFFLSEAKQNTLFYSNPSIHFNNGFYYYNLSFLFIQRCIK